MEVTKSNFEHVLPHFVALLDTCAFYSFDLEMTGITDPEEAGHAMTAPAADRFRGKFAAASKFSIIQLGVCLFHAAEGDGGGKQKFVARPFNFYLFSGDGAADCVMNVETVAGFLTKHGMDFTKWIAEGVPYLNKQKAAEARAAAGAERAPRDFDQGLLAKIDREDHRLFTDLMATVQNFAEESERDAATPPIKFPYFKNRSTMSLFEQYMRSLGLAKHAEKKATGGAAYTIVSSAEGAQRERERVERRVGGTRLYEALARSRKVAVAHNSLLDHLFMHCAFDGAPLAALADFKAMMRGRFPTTFDTRALALHPSIEADPKTNQNLEGQHKFFGERHGAKVAVALALGFETYECHAGRAHEAAYDALLTGRLLLYLAHELGDGTVAGLLQYKNRIPVFRCLETIDLEHQSDGVMHDGPVLVFRYAAGGLNTVRIDGMLGGSGALRGRLLWNRDCTFLFAPKAARGDAFERHVGDLRAKLLAACDGAALEVVIP
jgi:hypothetical protein